MVTNSSSFKICDYADFDYLRFDGNFLENQIKNQIQNHFIVQNEEKMTPKKFLADKKNEIVELQTLLTSIPAIAPEGGGDGEEKKAVALENWLRHKGFEKIIRYEIPDERVSAKVRPSILAEIPGKKESLKTFWLKTFLNFYYRFLDFHKIQIF